MKKINFDKSRMSISSDDMNMSSSVSYESNDRVDSGSTRKCLFGIIILGCLVLSILIALDVISLKQIINLPSSLLSKKQNNPHINANNQVNQENKQPINTNPEKKPEEKKPEENKQPVNPNTEKKPEEKKQEEKKPEENKQSVNSNAEKKPEENKPPANSNTEKKPEENKQPANSNTEKKPEEKKEDKKEEKKEEDKEKKDENKEEKKEEKKEQKKEEDKKGDKKEEKKEEDKKEEDNKEEKKEKEKEKNEEKKDENKEEDEEVKPKRRKRRKKVKKVDNNDEEKEDKEKKEDVDEEKKDKKEKEKENEKEQKKGKNKEKEEDDEQKKDKKESDKDQKEDKEKKGEDEDKKDKKEKEKEKDKDQKEDKEKKDDDEDKKDKKEKEKENEKEQKEDKEKKEEDNEEKKDKKEKEKESDKDQKEDKEKKEEDDKEEKDEKKETKNKNKNKKEEDDEEKKEEDDKEEKDEKKENKKDNEEKEKEKEKAVPKKRRRRYPKKRERDEEEEDENSEEETSKNETIHQKIKPKKKIKKKFSDDYNGNIGLNPNYTQIDPNDKKYTYVPIVGIDDVHGLFFPKINKIKIGKKTLEYKTGGLEYVTKYLNILREDFGPERVLYFDAGDFYQGGIDSVLFNGEIMVDFYNLIGINGTTIGNHEFDYSRKWIERKIRRGNYNWLINNIKDNATNRFKGALGRKHQRSRIYDVKLENGDVIKIGVIGLSFNMKNDKTMPNTWGNRNSWDNISFYPYIEKLERQSRLLRRRGAVAVLALAHFGLVCNQTSAMKLDMYDSTSVQGKCLREDDDSVMYKLTDKLKPGIIDGIIGGDTHMEMHHWENGIPLMSTPTHARYINIMYLPFIKDKEGNYSLVNKEIKIEGPLPACEKIFENYQNCELIAASEYKQAGKLINFTWRGEQIQTDESVQPIYDKYYKRYKNYAEQDIVTFEGFDKIKVDKSGDCTLCNTYLDAIADIKNADFAIINRGIFPEELVPGTLTRAEFYNQMPYLDKICTVFVTGKELKDIVETVQSVGKGFYPSSNLKQTIKIDEDGNKTVTKVELYVNGTLTQINDTQLYKMASSLFVLSETSGEDFAKGKSFKIIHDKAVKKQVFCSKKTIDEEMSLYFKGKGVVDLSTKYDEKKPRIVIEK